jgi:glycosidase
MKTIIFILLFTATIVSAANLKISPNSSVRAGSEVEANYTTTHLFIDETASDSIPVTIFFDPGTTGVESAEVFTNLNRRDKADGDTDGDGVEDGIIAPNGNNIAAGNDNHYYKVYPMALTTGGYIVTINANKTGAYRLSARYRLNGDAPGTYRWYSDTDGGGKRDHCFVISPNDARDINLYEVNVFNVEASGDTFATRSTLEDLHNATGATHNTNNRWDLDYIKDLGCNWLWFQPIHPNGISGREIDPGTSNPYDPGSPYAVKNFFEVNELMSVNYSGSNTIAQNRAASMTAFQNFVAAADAKGVGVMLDAPFNHTAFDVELAAKGVELFSSGSVSTDEIRNKEARFFSLDGNYGSRASSAANIAAGPDRFDFGKWNDVKDVFFGRYDALVEEDVEPERSSYKNEGDWFDTTTVTGSFDSVTHGVWKYFAEYSLHWLDKTGVPVGTDLATQTVTGVDGLRADFGQGLPPQCWEYIVNRTRTRKWNFVFMAESLDGGEVTYRSARHFDILNENIVFPLKSATNKFSYRTIFEDRRNAYGQGLVLMNTSSHDEESYTDPWQAIVRTAVTATNDGLAMIFPGQELGISRTFGYSHYETNFGKQIAHFKRWNSMMPIWNDTNYGNDQIYPVLAGMLNARNRSPALRSSNRWFLDGDGGNDQIHAVAKYETPNASPATSDVVIAFANLDRNTTHSDNFKVPSGLATLLGLQDGRTYNAKNSAAYIAQQSNRRDLWLWGGGITGANLKSTGFFVNLYKVPVANSTWIAEPYEAQYLKLYDVTAPVATPAQPEMPNVYAYAVGTDVTFNWADVAADAGGVVPSYAVTVTINGSETGTFITTQSTYTVTASIGDQVSVSVKAVNPDYPSNAGLASTQSDTVKTLLATADEDGDGRNNASEEATGTNPLDSASVFVTTSIVVNGPDYDVTFSTVIGRYYHLETSTDLGNIDSWTIVDGNSLATGASMTLKHTGGSASVRRFYRVQVTETALP